MLEIARLRFALVTCVAASSAVDAVLSTGGDAAFRVAPDEAMVLGEAGTGPRLAETAARAALRVDADAVVVDATDGWTAWALIGARALDAFARLSQIQPRERGYLQGEVARVPARVVVGERAVHVFAPAMWDAFLRQRILADCAVLAPSERREALVWGAS